MRVVTVLATMYGRRSTPIRSESDRNCRSAHIAAASPPPRPRCATLQDEQRARSQIRLPVVEQHIHTWICLTTARYSTCLVRRPRRHRRRPHRARPPATTVLRSRQTAATQRPRNAAAHRRRVVPPTSKPTRLRKNTKPKRLQNGAMRLSPGAVPLRIIVFTIRRASHQSHVFACTHQCTR